MKGTKLVLRMHLNLNSAGFNPFEDNCVVNICRVTDEWAGFSRIVALRERRSVFASACDPKMSFVSHLADPFKML